MKRYLLSLEHGWLDFCLRNFFFATAVWYWVWVIVGTAFGVGR